MLIAFARITNIGSFHVSVSRVGFIESGHSYLKSIAYGLEIAKLAIGAVINLHLVVGFQKCIIFMNCDHTECLLWMAKIFKQVIEFILMKSVIFLHLYSCASLEI